MMAVKPHFTFSRDGKALERFLQDYFDGNLKKYLKSEPVPESNDGPVKVSAASSVAAASTSGRRNTVHQQLLVICQYPMLQVLHCGILRSFCCDRWKKNSLVCCIAVF